MADLQTARKALGRYIADPIVKILLKTHVTPDALTWTGAVIACGAGVLAGLGHLFAAGWVLAFAGLFDMLDGALARLTNRTTRFGAVLDSTLDRVSEAAAVVGLVIYYARDTTLKGSQWVVILALVGLVGAQLVSYIRARAEGMGLKCDVGVFTRPERVIILSLGFLLSRFHPVLFIALGIIAVLSWITAGQRLYEVHKKTEG